MKKIVYSIDKFLNLISNKFTPELNKEYSFSIDTYIDIGLGNPELQYFYISNVSSNKKELELTLIDGIHFTFNENILDDITKLNRWIHFDNYHSLIINYKVLNDKLYIKLYDEIKSLSKEDLINTSVWFNIKVDNISKEKYKFYTLADKIKEDKANIPVPDKILYTPNFNAVDSNKDISYNANKPNVKSYNNFKSLIDLIDPDNSSPEEANVSELKYRLNKYSNNIKNSKIINIDYSEWENFIFFSSAKQRLINFKNKLVDIQNIEYSNQTEAIKYNKISKILKTFDGYEHYMYYAKQSPFKKQYNLEDLKVWPKDLSTGKCQTYALVIDSWYQPLLKEAENYDWNNKNRIKNLIPDYILNEYDNPNDEFIKFMDVVAHYFDNLILQINSYYTFGQVTEENIELYPLKSLIYNIAQKFNIQLNENYDFSSLWEYIFGSNSDFIKLNQDNSSINSISKQDISFEIWNRLINNWPYIIKRKGTIESIKALMNCYGVSTSLLQIKEFGGENKKDGNDSKEYSYVKLNHELNLENTNNIIINYNNRDDNNFTFTGLFRIDNTNDILDGGTYKLLDINNSSEGDLSFDIEISNINSQNCDINFCNSSQTISELNILDGNIFMLAITADDTSANIFTLHVLKYYYNTIVHEYSSPVDKSAMITSTPDTNIKILNDIISGFEYSIKELRFWNINLTNEDLENHCKYVNSLAAKNYSHEDIINSNKILWMALPLSRVVDHSSAVTSLDPSTNTNYFDYVNSTNIDSIEFNNFILHSYYPYSYKYFYDEMNILVPSINSLESNKIRIPKATYDIDTVYKNQRVIRYSTGDDVISYDSNKVGIYFSPVEVINEKIIKYLSGYNFDNVMGDPSTRYKNTYTELNNLAKFFMENFYDTNISFYTYFKLLSYYNKNMFKQIKELIPAKAKAIVGRLVTNSYLYRNKYKNNKPNVENSLIPHGNIDLQENTNLNSNRIDYNSINHDILKNIILTKKNDNLTISDQNLICSLLLSFDYESNKMINNTTLNLTNLNVNFIKNILDSIFNNSIRLNQDSFSILKNNILIKFYDISTGKYRSILEFNEGSNGDDIKILNKLNKLWKYKFKGWKLSKSTSVDNTEPVKVTILDDKLLKYYKNETVKTSVSKIADIGASPGGGESSS